MKIRTRLLVLLPLAFAATACMAFADPPSWAPAHGYRAKHHYVYYPNGEMYYAPQRGMWFWLSGSGWQAGVQLPLALRAYARVGGVNIELDASRPYTRHTYVERRYGGRRVRWERHRHERGDRDERHRHRRYRRDDDHGHRRGHGHGDDGDDD